MNNLLYKKNIECPVCDEKFITIAAKKIAYKVKSRDTDFKVTYQEINPTYYEVILCPFCGYAALQSHFSTITPKRSKMVYEMVGKRWVPREIQEEIDNKIAMERYKLALISAQVSKAKSSELGVICLKIGWLFRELQNEIKEIEFLTYAVHLLENAFNSERFPIEKMDEASLTYLVGELYRRIGKMEEASYWMSRVISNRMASARIVNMARDQWRIIKEFLKSENNKNP